jgi:hypothetical protein
MQETKIKLVVITNEEIRNRIFSIRGVQVMLENELAELYEVETKVFNQAVKRNIGRFPNNFRFQLTQPEYEEILRSQIVTSSGHGGRRYLPYVFTEQGVAMLSSVLSSKRAVQVNIEIMRTFVRLRKLLLSNKELSQRLEKFEKKYNAQFKVVFDAIRFLMEPEIKQQQRIGF